MENIMITYPMTKREMWRFLEAMQQGNKGFPRGFQGADAGDPRSPSPLAIASRQGRQGRLG
uniref:Uncharacterized protein n=1 Tax=Moorena producens (strain JHB) TaxID=1454205 RepID=A0A1D9G3T5_MOOP1